MSQNRLQGKYLKKTKPSPKTAFESLKPKPREFQKVHLTFKTSFDRPKPQPPCAPCKSLAVAGKRASRDFQDMSVVLRPRAPEAILPAVGPSFQYVSMRKKRCSTSMMIKALNTSQRNNLIDMFVPALNVPKFNPAYEDNPIRIPSQNSKTFCDTKEVYYPIHPVK
jgi:hypothetical protein